MDFSFLGGFFSPLLIRSYGFIGLSFAGITASPLCKIAGPVSLTAVVPFLYEGIDPRGFAHSDASGIRCSAPRSPNFAEGLILSIGDGVGGFFTAGIGGLVARRYWSMFFCFSTSPAPVLSPSKSGFGKIGIKLLRTLIENGLN